MRRAFRLLLLALQALLLAVPVLALPAAALAGSCCNCSVDGKATCLQDPPGKCADIGTSDNPDLKGVSCADLDPAQCKPIAQSGVCAVGPTPVTGFKKAGAPAGGFVIHITAPVLNVPIPGLEFPSDRDVKLTPGGKIQIPFLSQYISAAYKYLVGISVVAASVMIVYGGFLYVLGSTFPSVSRGKDIIQDAVIGLILLFGLVVMIDTVNANISESLTHPLEIFAIQKLEKPISLIDAKDYQKMVSGGGGGGGGAGGAAGGNINFDTPDCQFALQTQGKYAGVPTSKSVYECGIKLAAANGVHPCFAVVALNNESGGLSNAWGNDANVGNVGGVIPQARLNFLRSGKKYSGATFDVPAGLPSDCGAANKDVCISVVKQASDIKNDDGPPNPDKPEWGLDWRPGFSHGIGPKQTTIWKPFCDANIPSRVVSGKCYTIRDLLMPAPALISGLQLMKSSGADMNPTYDSAHKVWIDYAGKDNANAVARANAVVGCVKDHGDDPFAARIGGLQQYDK